MAELVQKLLYEEKIVDTKVAEAMSKVDRRHFCDEFDPYVDRSQEIGFGSTISSPSMHGYILD